MGARRRGEGSWLPPLELKKTSFCRFAKYPEIFSRAFSARKIHCTSFNLVAKRRKNFFVFVAAKNGGLLKIWVILRPSEIFILRAPM